MAEPVILLLATPWSAEKQDTTRYYYHSVPCPCLIFLSSLPVRHWQEVTICRVSAYLRWSIMLCQIVNYFIMPSGTVVPGGLMCYVLFLFFFPVRDLRAPSADCCETLLHYRKCVQLCNPGPKKFGGPSPKKCGGQIRAKFDAFSDNFRLHKYLRNSMKISKIRKMWSTAIPSMLGEKSLVNSVPLTTKLDVSLDPRKSTFWKTILQPQGVADPSN